MRVRIFQPHTHAGTRHEPGPQGLVIDVPEAAGQWLIAHAGAVAYLDAPWPFPPAQLEPDALPEAEAAPTTADAGSATA